MLVTGRRLLGDLENKNLDSSFHCFKTEIAALAVKGSAHYYWWLQHKKVHSVSLRHLFASTTLIIIVSCKREAAATAVQSDRHQQQNRCRTVSLCSGSGSSKEKKPSALNGALKSWNTGSLTHTSTTLQLLLYFNEHFWSRQTFFHIHTGSILLRFLSNCCFYIHFVLASLRFVFAALDASMYSDVRRRLTTAAATSNANRQS